MDILVDTETKGINGETYNLEGVIQVCVYIFQHDTQGLGGSHVWRYIQRTGLRHSQHENAVWGKATLYEVSLSGMPVRRPCRWAPNQNADGTTEIRS